MQFDLVFEGGGAKGMVFVGAMDVFEQQEHTYDRLLGTSAGAITAVLLAAGYSSQEMLDALKEREAGKPVFAHFMGNPGPFATDDINSSATLEFVRNVRLPYLPRALVLVFGRSLVRGLLKLSLYRHLFSFVEKGGWYTADRFVSWLQEKLNTGTFNDAPRVFGSMTLKEFFDATGRELTVIASDTTEQRMLALNHRTAPDCPVVWAVRMSMSIPFIWQEVEWKASWGTYKGREIAEHAIVDGGVLSNFPIELLVADSPAINELLGEKTSEEVLGMLINEDLPVPGVSVQPVKKKINLSELRTVGRALRLVNTMRTARDKDMIEGLADLIVHLPAAGYGTTEFDMDDDKRNKLVEAGREAMRTHLAGRDLSPRRRRRTRRGSGDPPSRADKMAERILGAM